MLIAERLNSLPAARLFGNQLPAFRPSFLCAPRHGATLLHSRTRRKMWFVRRSHLILQEFTALAEFATHTSFQHRERCHWDPHRCRLGKLKVHASELCTQAVVFRSSEIPNLTG